MATIGKDASSASPSPSPLARPHTLTRIIAMMNQKGGVGKTTTTVNLAAGVAQLGRSTLLIDLDPQAHATLHLGIADAGANRPDAASPDAPSVYDVLHDPSLAPSAVVASRPLLGVLPAVTDLAAAETELAGASDRQQRLSAAIELLKRRFEFIFIDCPPSLGLLTLNALVAANAVLIPLQCEYYALEGLARLLGTVERVRASYNAALEREGIVLTMVDRRANLSQQVENDVRSHFGTGGPGCVFSTVIPRNVRLSEAPSHGKPILLYDISSRGAVAYLQLAEELLRRHPRAERKPPALGA